MITCDGSGLGRICVTSEPLDVLLIKRVASGNMDNNLAEAVAIREANQIRNKCGRPELIILNDNRDAIKNTGVQNVRWIEPGELFLAGLVLHKMYVREYSLKTGKNKGKVQTPYNRELNLLNSTHEQLMPLHESQVVMYIKKTLGSGDLRHSVRSRDDIARRKLSQ
jgi:hypothetical protein